jgi:hypothetical protein
MSLVRRANYRTAVADVVGLVSLHLRPVPVINPAKRWVVVLLSIYQAVGFLEMVLVMVQMLTERPCMSITFALPLGIFLMGAIVLALLLLRLNPMQRS